MARRTPVRRASLGVLAGALLLLPATGKASPTPLGLSDCRPAHGTHQCSGLVRTWDGVPLDTTVTLPSGEARGLPLVVLLHGFGNSKNEYLDPAEPAYTGNAFTWARRGYAVLTYTSRGLWGSCGTPGSRLASPLACLRGYIRLADVRYEVRDTQELVGRLVDEGTASRGRIGVTGDSYGGGQSLALAALRDRMMLPDGSLVPWRSPSGARLRIAAAAPVIPWSDLVYAVAPNGRVSPTGVTPRSRATSPVGVSKATVVNAIFLAAQAATGPGQPPGEPFVPGRPMGYLAPPGLDPEADVTSWVARTDLGEPYTDASARAVVDAMADFHSPYYIDPARRPAPLFLASGFTDDLFPVDEVLRFANRTHRLHPRASLAMLLGDFGHQRAANKPRERETLVREIRRWMDHHVRGRGRAPREGVTAFVQTCPRAAAPLGPFRARRFSGLARHRLTYETRATRTVSWSGLDPTVGLSLDPVTGGGDGCAETRRASLPETAEFTVAGPRRRAMTMIGAPRITAELDVRETAQGVAQLAARLWDVAPDGTRRLVARGFIRPVTGRNVRFLHPGAWRFGKGHSAVLQLLGADVPFGRPSNGPFRVQVRQLRVDLPVRTRPAGRR